MSEMSEYLCTLPLHPLGPELLLSRTGKQSLTETPKTTPSTPQVPLCKIMAVLTKESRAVFRFESYELCKKKTCYVIPNIFWIYVFVCCLFSVISSALRDSYVMLYIWVYITLKHIWTYWLHLKHTGIYLCTAWEM